MGTYWSSEVPSQKIQVPQPWFDNIAIGDIDLLVVKDEFVVGQKVILYCGAENIVKDVLSITKHINISDVVASYGYEALWGGITRTDAALKRIYGEDPINVIKV